MQTTQGDKRQTQRLRRRMAVLFDHDARVRAQTTNISHTGLCISSDFIAAPGTTVGGALALPGGGSANFEAAVVWARKVRGRDALTDKNTMGLEFIIPPGELYEALFDGSAAALAAAPALAAQAPAPALAPAPTPASASIPLLATSEQPDTSPGPVWSASPTGQVGRANATALVHHLAAHPDRYATSLGPAAAAEWIEQACVEAVAPHLSPAYTTVGVGLQLTVPQHPPLEVGSVLTATARVASISSDGYTLIFEVSISDGRREVAFGKHSRQVCAPRS
jgi:predicted thioesterase